MSDNRPGDFEQAADRQVEQGLFRELWHFLLHNKKWWLLPVLLVLLLASLFLLLAETGAAPFIYTLF